MQSQWLKLCIYSLSSTLENIADPFGEGLWEILVYIVTVDIFLKRSWHPIHLNVSK